jgi:hypothetical protein
MDLIKKDKKKFDIDKNDMILQYQKKLKDLKDKENAITLEDKKILKMLKDEEIVITLEDKKLLKMLKDEENNLQKEIDEENNGNCFKFLNF